MAQSMEKKDACLLAVDISEKESTDMTNASPAVVSSRHVQLPPVVQTSLPILSYCVASIVMTVTNKYVVSGDFNMVFLLLTVQVIRVSVCTYHRWLM